MGFRSADAALVQPAASKLACAAAQAFTDTAAPPNHAKASGAAQVTTAADPEVLLQRARKHIAAFATPDNARGAWAVGLTLVLWVGTLFVGMWWFKHAPLSSWWGLAGSALWVIIRIGTHVSKLKILESAIHVYAAVACYLCAKVQACSGDGTHQHIHGYNQIRTHRLIWEVLMRIHSL